MPLCVSPAVPRANTQARLPHKAQGTPPHLVLVLLLVLAVLLLILVLILVLCVQVQGVRGQG